jgi:predicted RNA-binding protein
MKELIYKLDEISNGWNLTIWEDEKLVIYYKTHEEAIDMLISHLAGLLPVVRK